MNRRLRSCQLEPIVCWMASLPRRRLGPLNSSNIYINHMLRSRDMEHNYCHHAFNLHVEAKVGDRGNYERGDFNFPMHAFQHRFISPATSTTYRTSHPFLYSSIRILVTRSVCRLCLHLLKLLIRRSPPRDMQPGIEGHQAAGSMGLLVRN